jgi:hypothetical protein
MTTFTCTAFAIDAATGACAMSRFAAPLGFTLAATWVATIFMLVMK